VVQHLIEAGIPVLAPAGGHAVYLDARRFLPHIAALQYPGQSLAVELYIEGGIRSVEIGTVMFGLDPHSGEEHPARLELLRLAIPRRVYTQSHMDYVLEAIGLVWERRENIRGMRIKRAPRFLRHFTAEFERI
jgi:tryptophanase